MKTTILDITGKKTKEIELPKVFSVPVREDLIAKVLEIKKIQQPYGPSPVAGKQVSASGKIVHRRHVWRSGYGRGISRIPRKIISRRGSQFNWIGAEISSTRGGRRAHPPKVISMANTLKINKKEGKTALASAISATANKKITSQKYQKITEKDLKELPIIVESKISDLKTKELNKSLKDILGKKMFEILSKRKTIRKGRGKGRGRKYKTNAGLLLVLGKNEIMKTNLIEIKNIQNLGIEDLSKGGPGRITIYTEQAIKDLGERFK
jgi:large subunit ribosomal protein L4e